jgi:glycosyltransferase involved in cell wall biosynthesis
MKIAFVMSEWACMKPIPTNEMFTSPRGLTGSEISFLMYAKQIAKAGHTVIVFSNFTHLATIDGIEYAKIDSLAERARSGWDVAVGWLDPRPLLAFEPKVKKILNQQVNDFHYCQGWEAYINLVTSPSNSHREYLKTMSTFTGPWEVLPNGVDTSVYKFNFDDRGHTMVYASSPDRGLHYLLEAFPKIKKRVPDAELHVFYDWVPFYNAVRQGDTETSYRLRYCKEMFDRLKGKGVTHHGSVSREKMVNVFSKMRLLTYPCSTVSYTEGFSVTTLEAAVSGCVPVIADCDALGEVYRGYVPMVEKPYAAHKDEYIDLVVNLLTDDVSYYMAQGAASLLSNLYNWDALGEKLLKMIQS